MKKIDLSSAKTLQDFHDLIIQEQESAHGENYCDMIRSLSRYVSKGDVYLELGTNQGGTTAAALLQLPSVAKLVDIKLGPYREYLQPIAQDFCEKENIQLYEYEGDSLSSESCMPCDVMLVDTVHRSEHLRKELSRHAVNCRKYIIAHDTSMISRRKNDSLFRVLENFTQNYHWKIVERNEKSVGFTVLERQK